MATETKWFLLINGEKVGPLSAREALAAYDKAKPDIAGILAWKDGMAGWEPVAKHLGAITAENAAAIAAAAAAAAAVPVTTPAPPAAKETAPAQDKYECAACGARFNKPAEAPDSSSPVYAAFIIIFVIVLFMATAAADQPREKFFVFVAAGILLILGSLLTYQVAKAAVLDGIIKSLGKNRCPKCGSPSVALRR